MENNQQSCVQLFMKNTGLSIEEAAEAYVVFLNELDSEIEGLKVACDGEAFESMKKIIHTIKGISSSYLALEIYKIAEEMERKLRELKTEGLDMAISPLAQEAVRLKRMIIKHFKDQEIELEV